MAANSHRPNRAPIRSRRRTTITTRWRALRAGSSLGLLLMLLCGFGGHRARAQDTGTADDSVQFNATTNATDENSGICQQLWMASDSNQDGKISRSEYINWVVNYGPFSPGCGIDQSLYVSQFLGDAPLAVTFEALACLCTSFAGGGNNASCCEDDPHLLLPTSSQVPSSYASTVCHAIDQVLEDQCTSQNGNATASTDANATGTTSDKTYNSTPPSSSEAPEGGGGETGSIPMNNSTTSFPNTDAGTTPTDGGGGGTGNRRLVQVVLPLLLVAAAAVFMALTLVVYQRRKYASHGRSGTSSSLSRSLGAVAADAKDRRQSGGNVTERADASSTSTDSDEEAPACDMDSTSAVTAKARSNRRRRSRVSSRRRPTSSTLIDIDTGAPVARRTVPKTGGTARRTTKSSTASSRRRKVHTSSLVDSLGRLEPLREVEEGLDEDEDDDDDATTSSGSDGAVALDSSSSSEASESTPSEASPSSSSRRHKVSFGDDNENDGDVDNGAAEAAPGKPSSLTTVLLDPIGTLLQDLWTSHLPSNDPPPPLSPNVDRDAPGLVRSGEDVVDLERQETGAEEAAGTGAPAVVVIPDAVIRRTKDNDESFDEVSL